MNYILIFGTFFVLLFSHNISIANDLNNDRKVGVEDAIFALEVASGFKSQINLSNGFNWTGNWESENKQYNVNDIVGYEGSSYICILTHNSNDNRLPTNPALWQAIALRGETGPQGPAGDSLFHNNESGSYYTTNKLGIGIEKPEKSIDIKGDINITGSVYMNSKISLSLSERCIFLGVDAGMTALTNNSDIYTNNIFLGNKSGYYASKARESIYIGNESGFNSKESINIFLGNQVGYNNKGAANYFIGEKTGYECEGSWNIFIGSESGKFNKGYSNIFLGHDSGLNHTIGSQNIFIGRYAGFNNINGYGNIFIGYKAGHEEEGSNKLIIDNSDTDLPLIYGEFDNDTLLVNGKLNVKDTLRLNPISVPPSNPIEGDMYMDKRDHTLKVFNGTEWKSCW